MEVSGQFYAPATLLPGNEILLPIGSEIGWASAPVWTWWWRGKFLPLPEMKPRSFSP